MKNINKRTLNFLFWKVLLEFPYVYLHKPFGFHLPLREIVRAIKYLINCQADANFNSQICELLTVFSQQLPQKPWIPENSSRAPLISSVPIPKQHKTLAMK